MAQRRVQTSVVIPAHRAWPALEAVLDGLAPQLNDTREVILVDSGSQAASCELARRWPWLRVISVAHRMLPGGARNLGAAAARGELLGFLDADTVPSERWLDRLEAGLTPQFDAVAGTILNGTPNSRIGTAEYLLACSETLPRRARPLRHAPSGNLLIRRGYFERVGGFREDLQAGEDTVLTFPLAKAGRLALAPGAAVWHSNRTELAPFLANQRRQGAGFVHICVLVPYPHRWVSRRRALLLAGPLRLLALGRCVWCNRAEARPAVRASPALALGTAAWMVGAFQARRRPLPVTGTPRVGHGRRLANV